MQLSDKLKEYLANSLMKDLESKEVEIRVKDEVIEEIGIKNGELKINVDDWKLKFLKSDEYNCELKRKVKALENDKIFHVNELQKLNSQIKESDNALKTARDHIKKWEDYSKELELDILNKGEKIKELEELILANTIKSLEPKGEVKKNKSKK